MGGFRLSHNPTSSARVKAMGRESLSSCAAAALQISSLSSRLTGKLGIFRVDSIGRNTICSCSRTWLWLNCDDPLGTRAMFNEVQCEFNVSSNWSKLAASRLLNRYIPFLHQLLGGIVLPNSDKSPYAHHNQERGRDVVFLVVHVWFRVSEIFPYEARIATSKMYLINPNNRFHHQPTHHQWTHSVDFFRWFWISNPGAGRLEDSRQKYCWSNHWRLENFSSWSIFFCSWADSRLIFSVFQGDIQVGEYAANVRFQRLQTLGRVSWLAAISSHNLQKDRVSLKTEYATFLGDLHLICSGVDWHNHGSGIAS